VQLDTNGLSHRIQLDESLSGLSSVKEKPLNVPVVTSGRENETSQRTNERTEGEEERRTNMRIAAEKTARPPSVE